MPYLYLLKFWKEALITVLITLIGSQYWYFSNQIDKQAINHQLTIAKAERHLDNVTAGYEYQLNQINQKALAKQNELLLIARNKEQKYNEKLAKLEKEKQANEKVISNLSDKLNASNDSLHELTKRATAIAKQAVSRGRTCENQQANTAEDKRRFTQQELSERIIEAQSEMAREYSEVAEQMSKDYAKLANECKALQESIQQ